MVSRRGSPVHCCGLRPQGRKVQALSHRSTMESLNGQQGVAMVDTPNEWGQWRRRSLEFPDLAV